MIEKLNHYSLTGPASVYDEEALTALELAGRTAQKVNEVIDLANNIPGLVEDKVTEMGETGELDSMLVEAIHSGKVDKGGIGQVTLPMLAQDVREALTGGAVPVVGPNAVLSENIVDGAVTEAKLASTNRAVLYHATDMDAPVLILNPATKTGTINPGLAENIKLYNNDQYWSITPADITVDATEWDGSYYCKLFYAPAIKMLKVTAFNKPGSEMYGYLNLGRLGWTVNDNVIPVQIGDRQFCAKTQTRLMDAPEGLKPVRIALDRFRHPDNAVFNVDTVTGTVTITKGGSYAYFAMNEGGTVNFASDNLEYGSVDFKKGAMYMWVDSVTGKIHFIQSIVDVPRWWHFFGMVYMSYPYMSTCVVPFTVNGRYYYHPGRNRREWANVIYSPYSYATKTLPYVDFANKKLVFPTVNRLYLNTNEMNMALLQSTGDNYEVPFEESDNSYQYLVGGPAGLKFINPTQFVDLMSGVDKDSLFYLGYCIQTGKTVSFTFDCLVGRTLSIIGDSISTYGGYIPEGNTPYYQDGGGANVNVTWWKRAMNRCGLSLCVNNSSSGSRVSNTATDGRPYGIEMAKHLDNNGTAPDIVIIYQGINDYNSRVGLGAYNGKGAIPATQDTFRESYAQMLHNVLTTYPKAKVYACTLPTIERTTGDIASPDMNGSGVYLMDYNVAIRELARAFCVEVIDLESCGIHHYNGANYMYDYDEETGAFVHPNSEGHRMISHKVIKALVDSGE